MYNNILPGLQETLHSWSICLLVHFDVSAFIIGSKGGQNVGGPQSGTDGTQSRILSAVFVQVNFLKPVSPTHPVLHVWVQISPSEAFTHLSEVKAYGVGLIFRQNSR